MTEIDNELIEKKEPRPAFLTVLCVLTFISTGLNVFSAISSLLSGPLTEEQLLESRVQMAESITDLKEAGMDSWIPMMEQMQEMTEQANNEFYFATIISLIVASIGAFAVMKMWNGFKQGFHLYIVYSLLSVVSIYLYISPENVPNVVIIFSLFFSGIFVFLYSRNLYWMTK